MAQAYPSLEFDARPMPFEQVMPSVKEGISDFGVIIHEGRFIYQDLGLEMKTDLGLWWEEKTNLPIPLGCIAVHRSLGKEKALAIQTLIRESIDHGFAHPQMGRDYIKSHAQEMADTVMGRWRIERDYEELKQELGLGHYEGRNWRGFHHHASLCIAAYGFLTLERLAGIKKNAARFKTPALPKGFRPRGAGTDAAP